MPISFNYTSPTARPTLEIRKARPRLMGDALTDPNFSNLGFSLPSFDTGSSSGFPAVSSSPSLLTEANSVIGDTTALLTSFYNSQGAINTAQAQAANAAAIANAQAYGSITKATNPQVSASASGSLMPMMIAGGLILVLVMAGKK